MIFLLDQGGGVFATHGTLFPPFSSHFFFSVSVSGVKAKKKKCQQFVCVFMRATPGFRSNDDYVRTRIDGRHHFLFCFWNLKQKCKKERRQFEFATLKPIIGEQERKKKPVRSIFFFFFFIWRTIRSVKACQSHEKNVDDDGTLSPATTTATATTV